jgi:hypothetical protein
MDLLVCRPFSEYSVANVLTKETAYSGSAVCRAALRHGYQVTSIR